MNEKTNKSIGIDLGLKKTATLLNGQEINNLNLESEEERIRFYQKKKNYPNKRKVVKTTKKH